MAKKTKSAKVPKARERRERRFEPRSTTPLLVIYLLGAVGALLMGAAAWEQFGSMFSESVPPPLAFAPYVLIGGAVLVAIAIWIGTSGEAALRVGDSGLAVEKGGIRRMPWYSIDRVDWRDEVVRVDGKDETGSAMTIAASLAAHPQAAAWIVKEARERVPAVVDVPEDASLPEPNAAAGVTLILAPPQVVGRHCAASGKVISYEPDARLCPRCERVFHKAHVPESCECGASLAEVRQTANV